MDSDWLKRRNAIDQELGGHEASVADVRVVQSEIWRGSRERGPCASHIGTIAAPAAGHHVGIKIDGFDGSAESSRNTGIWLQRVNFSAAVSAFLANRSVITLDAENEITPGWRDNDEWVRPRVHELDIQTANIPIAVAAGIPMFCATLVGNNWSREVLPSFLPGVFWFENTNQQSLFFVHNTAATILHYSVQWQAMRV